MCTDMFSITRYTHALVARSRVLKSLDRFNSEVAASHGSLDIDPVQELRDNKRRMLEDATASGEDKRAQELDRSVRRGLETIRVLFQTLEVAADGDLQFSTEQLILIKEIWGSCLPSLVGGQTVYKVISDEIRLKYGAEWKSKCNERTAGRRTGKSFAAAFAMAAMACVAFEHRGVFMNLAFHAGSENLNYMIDFIKRFEEDPKKRIKCKFIKKERIYYLRVVSHMQFEGIEENQLAAMDYIKVPPPNMIGSLPNMDSKNGSVRSPVFFSLVLSGSFLKSWMCRARGA